MGLFSLISVNLFAQTPIPEVAPALAKSAVVTEYPKIQVKGDLRHRIEQFDVGLKKSEEADAAKKDPEPYWRSQTRARLRTIVQINETVRGTIGLATGPDNPVSANETMTGNFAIKSFSLNLAQLDFTLIPDLQFTVGKFDNPLPGIQGSSLVWDGDVRPEGEYIRYKKNFDDFTLVPTLAHFTMKETSRTSTNPKATDNELIAARLAVTTNLGPASVEAGYGIMNYSQLKGKEYAKYNVTVNSGNSTYTAADAAGVATTYYGKDYELSEMYLGLTMKFLPAPISFYYFSVSNSKSDNNKASDIGLSYGTGKSGQDTFQVFITKRKIEKDSLVDSFNEGDFAGTDVEALYTGLNYFISQGINGAFTYWNRTKGLADDTKVNEVSTKNLRFDIGLSF